MNGGNSGTSHLSLENDIYYSFFFLYSKDLNQHSKVMSIGRIFGNREYMLQKLQIAFAILDQNSLKIEKCFIQKQMRWNSVPAKT